MNGSPRAVCSHRRRYRIGFSLLELLIVVLLLAVLATALLERLLYYQEAAEKANVEYTISTLRSALHGQMAALLVEGKAQEFSALVSKNPMDWLDRKPAGYIGSISNPDPKNLPVGAWYFDLRRHEIVYLVEHGRYFKPDGVGLKRIRLQLISVPTLSESMTDSGGTHATDSVRISLVENYSWL